MLIAAYIKGKKTYLISVSKIEIVLSIKSSAKHSRQKSKNITGRRLSKVNPRNHNQVIIYKILAKDKTNALKKTD
jgi:hypothetical protein